MTLKLEKKLTQHDSMFDNFLSLWSYYAILPLRGRLTHCIPSVRMSVHPVPTSNSRTKRLVWGKDCSCRVNLRTSFEVRKSKINVSRRVGYRSLNGSSDSVNSDLQFLWDRQISAPHKIDTPELINKKVGTVNVHERTHYTKFGTNPPTEGFWANGWNITKNIILFIPFFLRFAYRSDPWMDFYPRHLRRREITQDVPFGVWTMSP